MQYTIIKHKEVINVISEVGKMLRMGWKPLDGCKPVFDGVTTVYVQTMVKQ